MMDMKGKGNQRNPIKYFKNHKKFIKIHLIGEYLT